MMRPSFKCLLIGALATVVFVTIVPQADAQWWGPCRATAWGCGYGCYAPCYSTCYTPCCSTVTSCYPYCGSSWYLGWRPGPVRRLLFGRYRWYRGWDCCGLGCYDLCCDSCCGQVTADKPVQQSPTPATKAAPAPAAPASPAPALPGSDVPAPTTGITPDQSGVLTVWVPYEAKVTINGLETRSTGSRRQFVSYGLKPGLSYKYVVVAQVVRNGEVIEDTKTVVLTAGKITSLAFGFNADSNNQVALAK